MDLRSYGGAADDSYRNLKRPRYEQSNNENFYLSIDDALSFTGDNSRYQKRISYIFTIQYAVFSFLVMGFPLLLVKPIFKCKAEDGTYYACKEEKACSLGEDNFTTELNGESSLASDFHLYCDRSFIIGLLGSIMFAGAFIAFLFFPYIGDWKGRKIGMIMANVMSMISALGVGLVPDDDINNIYFIMGFIVLGGFAFSGFEILCFSYTAEISGERYRNISSVTLGTFWSIAQIVAAPLFLYAGNWRNVFIFYMAIPWFVTIWPLIAFVYETPRFLNSKKRFTEARDVINKICLINRRPAFRARLYGELEFETSKVATLRPLPRITQHNRPQETNTGYIDLFREPRLRKITLVLLYIWFFRNFTYFGLNYSLPVLGTEMYQNFTITAIAETVANLLAGKIKFMMERIRSLCYSMVLVSVSCLLIAFVPIPEECYVDNAQCYQKTLSVILAVIAKFSIGLFANILITYTSESYPTEVRSLGLGLTMTASRIGTVAMPFIITAMSDSEVNPLISFGAMGIMSFIMILWCLPETRNMLAPTFLLEMKEMKRRDEARQPLLLVNQSSSVL